MVTGPLLIAIFVLAITILLVSIIKFKLNAFVALMVSSIITGLLVKMPLDEIGGTVSTGFGNTLGGIGIVIGLGVMLGIFLFKSGGIESIAMSILGLTGDKKSPLAASFSGFLAGIPVFGDVVYVMFAPMLRALARRTKISMVVYVAAIAIPTAITADLMVPTPAPLAVADILTLDVGVMFIYGFFISMVGTLAAYFWGLFLQWQDNKKGRVFEVPAEEEGVVEVKRDSSKPVCKTGKALFVLCLPIALILIGSFGSMFLADGMAKQILAFLGNKNVALLIGVLNAAIILRKHITISANEIMTEAADQVGLIMLITGAGGSFGAVINASGIGTYLADILSGWSISILVLGFIFSQIIRVAQGSGTVALITASTVLAPMIETSGVSPMLCALAICAGGVGLSLPNDSGFWAVSRFNKISVTDTIRTWTIGGFVSGVVMLLFIMFLANFQQYLPGLM